MLLFIPKAWARAVVTQWAACWCVLFALQLFGGGARQPSGRPSTTGEAVIHACRSGVAVAHVGSKVCGECHAQILASFRNTRMGRSMTLPSDAAQLEVFARPATVHAANLDRTFQAYAASGELYHSESQTTPQGAKVFRETEKIVYVIGAGQNGYGYLVAKGPYLFESPLSFYTSIGHWQLSPGYGQLDLGFNRLVIPECLACHSGRSRPIAGRAGMYAEPAFEELSVGCENCHGPGARHVEERRKGLQIEGATDPSIVNPAKLSPWLTNNVCMACHEKGDVRVLQPGKSPLDFCPGTPLDETVGVYSVPLQRGAEDRSPLLQHYSLMILSQCYLRSDGKLTCITCHDPHIEPEGTQAVKFYRRKCLACHQEASCKLPLDARNKSGPPDDCIGCHMPKNNLVDISHSALTNHRIVARPNEPLPDTAFERTTRELPDLVHLSALEADRPQTPSPVTLLHVYAELRERFPEYQDAYQRLLTTLEHDHNSDPFVLSELARRAIQQNLPEAREKATAWLTQALAEGSTKPTDFEILADLLAASGKTSEAIDLLNQGIKLNPYWVSLYRTLAVHFAKAGRNDDALAVVRKELEIFPADAPMRAILKRAETAPAAGTGH